MTSPKRGAALGAALLSSLILVGTLGHPIKSSSLLNLSVNGVDAASQPTVKVDVGQLVILDASKSTATSFKWTVLPAANMNNVLVIDNGKRAVFSGTPGAYQVFLAGMDGAQVDSLIENIVVGNPAPTPTPTPTPTPPPAPADMATLVKGWVGQVNDPNAKAEAKALAISFQSVAAQINAGILTTNDVVTKSTALANQSALGTAKDAWKDTFFAPLKAELDKRSANHQLDTPAQHAALWIEISNGLLAASM